MPWRTWQRFGHVPFNQGLDCYQLKNDRYFRTVFYCQDPWKEFNSVKFPYSWSNIFSFWINGWCWEFDFLILNFKLDWDLLISYVFIFQIDWLIRKGILFLCFVKAGVRKFFNINAETGFFIQECQIFWMYI